MCAPVNAISAFQNRHYSSFAAHSSHLLDLLCRPKVTWLQIDTGVSLPRAPVFKQFPTSPLAPSNPELSKISSGLNARSAGTNRSEIVCRKLLLPARRNGRVRRRRLALTAPLPLPFLPLDLFPSLPRPRSLRHIGTIAAFTTLCSRRSCEPVPG